MTPENFHSSFNAYFKIKNEFAITQPVMEDELSGNCDIETLIAKGYVERIPGNIVNGVPSSRKQQMSVSHLQTKLSQNEIRIKADFRNSVTDFKKFEEDMSLPTYKELSIKSRIQILIEVKTNVGKILFFIVKKKRKHRKYIITLGLLLLGLILSSEIANSLPIDVSIMLTGNNPSHKIGTIFITSIFGVMISWIISLLSFEEYILRSNDS